MGRGRHPLSALAGLAAALSPVRSADHVRSTASEGVPRLIERRGPALVVAGPTRL